jgi:hypothetical protein
MTIPGNIIGINVKVEKGDEELSCFSVVNITIYLAWGLSINKEPSNLIRIAVHDIDAISTIPAFLKEKSAGSLYNLVN